MTMTRWGIISTGQIAHQFARGLQVLADAKLQAVGSRSQANAEAFGDQYNIPARYDSYEALVNDPAVDVVYIGTPHPFHHENILLSLHAGKHVLCEKPLTMNATQARACISLAREKGLFLMEGVWMRFIPAIVQLRRWMQEGVLGRVRSIHADFSVTLPFDPQSRVFKHALGGGALLDVGIYPINFATMILGLPQHVDSQLYMGETDVDYYGNMRLHYQAADALLSVSIVHDGPCNAYVIGSEGYVSVPREFWNPQGLTLHRKGAAPQTRDLPYSNGLHYEAADVQACIHAGKMESSIMPLDETLAIMQVMDEIRLKNGLTYAADSQT